MTLPPWRAALAVGATLALMCALSACDPLPDAHGTASVTATVESVIDGDTITTSAGTVRIIGIDTPERGECGYDAASDALTDVLLSGDIVTLELPDGQNDTDRHDRLLRYVTTASGTDVGLLQVQEGNAVARYDSGDGYPAHPRENAYHAAGRATLAADGTVVTTSCDTGSPTSESASPADRTDGWWTSYSSCTKLAANTVGDPVGPFSRDDPDEAEVYDWFAHGTGNNGDGDGDGLACEGAR